MLDKSKIGEPYNDKKSNTTIIERALKLIEYLKKNTDFEHKITQSFMRENDINDYMGNKTTFHKMILDLVKALNFEDGLLNNPSERRILFRDFNKLYDENEELIDDVKSILIKDIYYNHEFTQKEVGEIITALRMSRITEIQTAELLIDKVKSELASKYFKDNSVKIYNREYVDSERLRNNLALIQEAISKNKQITFYMGFYNNKKQFMQTGGKLKISPNFIIVNNGKFFVIGCFEYEDNNNKKLAVIRVDLMLKLQIDEDCSTNMLDIPALRQISEEKFKTLHLNMSYDEPITVEMKITRRTKDGKVNYNFIHDSFGDDYTFLRSEQDGDVIRVRCSKFGIVNWAVQYGEFVEVISPEHVIEKIKNKIETLKIKYYHEGEK